jgi:hypothetical protein
LFPFHSLGFSAKWVLTFSNKHHHSVRNSFFIPSDPCKSGVRFLSNIASILGYSFLTNSSHLYSVISKVRLFNTGQN